MRTLAYVILTFKPTKTDVTRLKYSHSHSLRVSSYVTVSSLSSSAQRCPRKSASLKNLAERQRFILPHFKDGYLLSYTCKEAKPVKRIAFLQTRVRKCAARGQRRFH